uniref:Uncharacterized protein n=1 Tax=Romanomermis culicivorax TaxID=13658 RepID=A0A915KFZ7_ROMCU
MTNGQYKKTNFRPEVYGILWSFAYQSRSQKLIGVECLGVIPEGKVCKCQYLRHGAILTRTRCLDCVSIIDHPFITTIPLPRPSRYSDDPVTPTNVEKGTIYFKEHLRGKPTQANYGDDTTSHSGSTHQAEGYQWRRIHE